MRTTHDIEADVLQVAKEIAIKEKTTAGAVISRLARSGLLGQSRASGKAVLRNGVPVIRGTGHVITLEHVQTLMDEGLQTFVSSGDHEFWPKKLSIRETAHFNPALIIGPRQITNLYLLALAAERVGRFVTFDEVLNLRAVPFAKRDHLCVI